MFAFRYMAPIEVLISVIVEQPWWECSRMLKLILNSYVIESKAMKEKKVGTTTGSLVGDM